jgi:hypothetical protein
MVVLQASRLGIITGKDKKMKELRDGDTGFAKIYNHIQEMEQGESTSFDAMMALGMTGSYCPKYGHGRTKGEAVAGSASFLLSGFSHEGARDPDYNILQNNGNGTFTRK